ncbi:MAG: glycosyltransferase, partial [bacterium]|nr:glycosyltransferase [bacterium]
WGRVIIEANSVGLPAVVFKAAGLADSVIHNQTGYIAIGEKEFISYIELLLNDLQKMSQMSNQAIEYSRQFSLSEIENKFINLFNSLTKSHS